MPMSYKENLKGFQEAQKRVDELDKQVVKVGVLGTAGVENGEDDAIDLVTLAIIHEFGVDTEAVHIPERSFIRATLRQKKQELTDLIGKLAAKVIEKKLEADQALGLLGQWAAAQMKLTIKEKRTEGPEPQANAPSTIKKKDSTTPLVDTGQLVGSISYEVVDKTGGK